MKRAILIFLLLFSYVGAQEMVLGVVPQQSPLKLAKKWSKVTQYLEQATGIKVIFKTEKSISRFEKQLYAGKYDIAYMNPYHFVVAKKQQSYAAFTRAKKNIVGIVLSKSKKVDFNASALKGKVFLFPAPNAFAATLLPKYEFKSKFGFDVDKEGLVRYVNSHDSVYKGISRDIGYLGGGIIRTFNNFVDKNDKDKLHIVYKTSPYPSHPIAAHPRVDEESIKKLQMAFIDMPQDLKKRLSIKAFKKTTSSEYDVIAQIGVK
jgi:phosphonate transport system substrate-binding protein